MQSDVSFPCNGLLLQNTLLMYVSCRLLRFLIDVHLKPEYTVHLTVYTFLDVTCTSGLSYYIYSRVLHLVPSPYSSINGRRTWRTQPLIVPCPFPFSSARGEAWSTLWYEVSVQVKDECRQVLLRSVALSLCFCVYMRSIFCSRHSFVHVRIHKYFFFLCCCSFDSGRSYIRDSFVHGAIYVAISCESISTRCRYLTICVSWGK